MKLLKCRKILLMLRQITTMLWISLPRSHGKKLLKPIKTFLRLLENIKKLSMNYISLLLFWLQVEIQQSKPMNTKSKRQCMMYKLKNLRPKSKFSKLFKENLVPHKNTILKSKETKTNMKSSRNTIFNTPN